MKTTNQEINPLYDVQAEDAIGMLIADHKRVANLFADFKRLSKTGDEMQKASVVAKICQELTVHAELEEEIFYPAVRKAIDDDDQMDEALIEHAGAKSLIAQLESAAPSDELYDAKVTVLGEQIDHHVEEEEGSMFPKARYSGVDTAALGARMLKHKSELLRGVAASATPPTASNEKRFDESDEGKDADHESLRTAKKKAARRKSSTKSPR